MIRAEATLLDEFGKDYADCLFSGLLEGPHSPPTADGY